MFGQRMKFDISETINRMADIQTENRLLERDVAKLREERDAALKRAELEQWHNDLTKHAIPMGIAHARMRERVEMWHEAGNSDSSLFEIQVPKDVFKDLNIVAPHQRASLGLADNFASEYGLFQLRVIPDSSGIRILPKTDEPE